MNLWPDDEDEDLEGRDEQRSGAHGPETDVEPRAAAPKARVSAHRFGCFRLPENAHVKGISTFEPDPSW